MITFKHVEKFLDTYTLDEILELNDITEVELLYFLIEEEFLELPDPKPSDIDLDE